MVNIGPVNNYNLFSKQSHNWAELMNFNLIKMATSFHLSVKSIASPLPSSPNHGDTYIDLASENIAVYIVNDEIVPPISDWHYIGPQEGTLALVEDQEKYFLYTINGWEEAFDLNGHSDPIERNLSFYAPGSVRPNSMLFHYIPTMEFKIPAGAPNSFATLETAPSGGDMTVAISSSGGSGTITFADGQTDGVFTVNSDIVILPADFESIYSQPQPMGMSVGNPFGAVGLSISLKGEIRSIDVG